MDIHDYYKQARKLDGVLEEIKQTHKVHRRKRTIQSVEDDTLQRLQQLKHSHQAYLDSNPNKLLLKFKTKRYRDYLAGYNLALDKLQDRVVKVLTNELTHARVFGFGYTEHHQSEDAEPVAIPPDHWISLALDIEKNQAHSGQASYTDLRFLTVSDLETMGGLHTFAEVLDQYTSEHPEKIPVDFSEITFTLDHADITPGSSISWNTRQGKTKGSISFADSGLLMKNGELNAKGRILMGIARGEHPGRDKRMNVGRLEVTIQGWLNTETKAFVLEKKGKVYRPLFTVDRSIDK